MLRKFSTSVALSISMVAAGCSGYGEGIYDCQQCEPGGGRCFPVGVSVCAEDERQADAACDAFCFTGGPCGAQFLESRSCVGGATGPLSYPASNFSYDVDPSRSFVRFYDSDGDRLVQVSPTGTVQLDGGSCSGCTTTLKSLQLYQSGSATTVDGDVITDGYVAAFTTPTTTVGADGSFQFPNLSLALSVSLKDDGVFKTVDPDARRITPPEFGDFFAQAIRDTGRLVVLLTENTEDSRWVPWELGLAHGVHGQQRAAVWPVFQNPAQPPAWLRQEYLLAYPVLERESLVGGRGEEWVVRDPHSNPRCYWRLAQWLSL